MKLTTRAVAADDRAALLSWRNDSRVREMSLNDAEITAAEHDRWFDALLSGDTSHVVIALDGSTPNGIVRLSDIDLVNQSASWSCHSGAATLTPGFGAVLPIIGLALGFERFGLRRLHAEVLGSNKNMRGIHRRLGLSVEGTRRQHIRRPSGDVIDVYEFGVLREEWPEVLDRTLRLIPNAIGADLRAIVNSIGQGDGL